MSWQHSKAVSERFPGKPPGLKVLAFVMAEMVDDTGMCFPSFRTLARRCECTESYSKRLVKILLTDGRGLLDRLDRGGIFKDPDTGRQIHRSNVYRLNLAAIEALPKLPNPDEAAGRRKIRAEILSSLGLAGRVHEGSPCGTDTEPVCTLPGATTVHPAAVHEGSPQPSGGGIRQLESPGGAIKKIDEEEARADNARFEDLRREDTP